MSTAQTTPNTPPNVGAIDHVSRVIATSEEKEASVCHLLVNALV